MRRKRSRGQRKNAGKYFSVEGHVVLLVGLIGRDRINLHYLELTMAVFL
jgi:hypothetical protein